MANRAHRFIQLDNEENSKLRAIEQNVHMKAKVRLRAQVLRLSKQGSGRISLCSKELRNYTKRLTVGKKRLRRRGITNTDENPLSSDSQNVYGSEV